MAAVVLGVLAVGLAGVVVVRRRGRGDPDGAERAVRAAVRRRMTAMHPDFVRDWMRPR